MNCANADGSSERQSHLPSLLPSFSSPKLPFGFDYLASSSHFLSESFSRLRVESIHLKIDDIWIIVFFGPCSSADLWLSGRPNCTGRNTIIISRLVSWPMEGSAVWGLQVSKVSQSWWSVSEQGLRVTGQIKAVLLTYLELRGNTQPLQKKKKQHIFYYTRIVFWIAVSFIILTGFKHIFSPLLLLSGKTCYLQKEVWFTFHL